MATTRVNQPSSLEAEPSNPNPLARKSEKGPGRWFGIRGLQGKLILPYVFLTLFLAGLGVFIITQLMNSTVTERFDNQVYATTRLVKDSFVRLERRHLDGLQLMVSLKDMPQFIRQKDAQAMEQILQPVMANQRIEILTAVDLEGREIFTRGISADGQSYTTTQGGADLSNQWLVRSVLRLVNDSQGDKFAQLLKTEVGWVLFTSAPVRDASGNLSGVLMVGSSMDTVLAEIKKQSQADIMVLDSDYSVIAASVVEPEEGFAHYQEIARRAKPGNEAQLINTTLDRTPYGVTFSSLQVRGETVGWVGVLVPSNYVVSLETSNRNTYSLIFGVSTLLFIMVGYYLAQNIATPLLRLRQMTQAVAEGNLNQRIHLQRADEIGDLANAFDTMTVNLKERTERVDQLLDETQQRNVQLQEMNERLKATQLQLVQSEKLAAIGQLTAGIVHDVKNPFAVIMGMAEVLMDENLDENAMHGLKVIRESAMKGNTIVQDLLKFARQSKSEMKLNDLRDTVESALRLTAYLTRRFELVTELPERSLYTTYDSQQIEQVLINMIHNGVQSMPNGGCLRVSLRTVDQNAIIEIEDTGEGIAPELIQRIFDPFFTTKPEGEGTGLGLSVSYGIVANHHGWIEVDSAVGRGTRFTIFLPIVKNYYATEDPM